MLCARVGGKTEEVLTHLWQWIHVRCERWWGTLSSGLRPPATLRERERERERERGDHYVCMYQSRQPPPTRARLLVSTISELIKNLEAPSPLYSYVNESEIASPWQHCGDPIRCSLHNVAASGTSVHVDAIRLQLH